jgi:hypothetical protein
VDNLDIIFNDKNRFLTARLSSLAEKLYLHAVIKGNIAYVIFQKAENKLIFFGGIILHENVTHVFIRLKWTLFYRKVSTLAVLF